MKTIIIIVISILAPLTTFAQDFDGTIKSIGKCKQPKVDQRFCRSMVIKLNNGNEISSGINIDTAIYDEKGILFDTGEGDMPHSDAENKKDFVKALRNLKKGRLVRIAANCSDRDCVATQIEVK